jgi:cellulose synthase/poly-beta-1,6-N-acetylglucosamine synthase-like glycosyltransferase
MGVVRRRSAHCCPMPHHDTADLPHPLPTLVQPAPMTAGWTRRSVPGRDMPRPESRRRRRGIQLVALLAIAVTVVYLAWRIAATLAPDALWLAIPMVALEIHAAIGLFLFAFGLWDVDRRPATHDVLETDARIAVLVPTYDESVEILLPTVAAAVSLRLPHETWVLDDGDRPEVERLAAELGARYLARPDHAHAKAGNLNHALGVVDADFVAIFDADHVADPAFLTRTLGYFDDPRVAIVQTPQDFYNRDSFEHDASGEETERFHEQTLFYRVLQPGKNRVNGAFWCGTGAVVRVAALREVGGVATGTITEDIHTTIRLHRRGWRTVYHNEVLARGLAAGDAGTYQAQRLRWGTGAMQVLRGEDPLFMGGLSLGQRLAYAGTLLGWFDAWRTLGFLLLPMVVIATGAVPIRADLGLFVVAFGATLMVQQLALRALSRGCHRPVLSTMFELVRMSPNLRATLTLVTGGRPRFAVTPKGRQDQPRRTVHEPWLLRVVALLSVASAAWYAATLLGVTPVHYAVPWAVHGAFFWLVVNFALVMLAIARVRSSRFGPERRSSVRFTLDLPATYGGRPGRVLDLSLTGARLHLTAPPLPGAPVVLAISLGGRSFELPCVGRKTRHTEGGYELGLEFGRVPTDERAALALALFRAAALEPIGAPAIESVEAPGRTRLVGATAA